jgi:hypothetical protein
MHKDKKRKAKPAAEDRFAGYRDMDSMPDGPVVSVMTRAFNIRGCRLIDGVPHYRSVHGAWFPATAEGDPPQRWWDGSVPGSKTGRYYYPEMLEQTP